MANGELHMLRREISEKACTVVLYSVEVPSSQRFGIVSQEGGNERKSINSVDDP